MGAKHQTQERIDWDRVNELKAQHLTPEQIRERLGIGHSMRPRKEAPKEKRVTGEDIINQFVSTHEQFTNKELMQYLMTLGYTNKASLNLRGRYFTLLIAEGRVERLSPGLYRRTS